MNTDKEVIETLLTALETALDIALDNTTALQGTWGIQADLIALKHLQEYADFERSQLNEAKP